MDERTDEQILREIEVHNGNVVKLLKRAHEIHMSALDMDNLDAYIALMKRAIAFQQLSVEEMDRAVNLQNILSRRQLDSLICHGLKFGVL